ncbi:MAG: Trm112 family protein [Gammaproteobacteria bacterium]|nr:Trm112 family protein [Gammaproteobacteria bacterium]
MTIERKLLEILVCPVTKLSVSLLNEERLVQLNQLIDSGEVQSMDGTTLENRLAQALITVNGSIIYPVEDNIPVMLENSSISTHQLAQW